MRQRNFGITLVSVAAALTLAACGKPVDPFNPLEGFKPTRAEILSAGWVVDGTYTPPPRAPVFCYRTLGDADCHAEPLAGAEGRFIGWTAGSAY